MLTTLVMAAALAGTTPLLPQTGKETGPRLKPQVGEVKKPIEIDRTHLRINLEDAIAPARELKAASVSTQLARAGDDVFYGGVRPQFEMTALRGDIAFVSLEDKLIQPDRFLFRKSGKELKGVSERGGVQLRKGEQVWLYNGELSERTPNADETNILCGVLINLGREGEGKELDVRLLEVWSSFAQAPLVWNEGGSSYGTVVRIGVRVAAGMNNERDLPNGIEVFLGGKGAGVDIKPQRIVLERIGGAAEEIQVRCARHNVEGALVTTLEGQALEHPFEIGPSVATLRLVPDVLEVPGFGLGEVEVSLERLAEDGELYAGTAELVASLTADHGALSASEVSLPVGSSRAGGVRLISRGVGEAVLTASAGGLASAPLVVHFTWPWELFLASVIGGAAGGWVRRRKAGGGGEGGSEDAAGAADPVSERIKTRMAVGAAIGLATVVAALTGLASIEAVPRGVVGSIAGAFLLALLAGFVGRSVLDRLARGIGLGSGA